MWTSEAMEKLGKAYFLRNKAWYTGTDPDGPEAEADDCPIGYKLTDKAPEEAVVSYNHCFDISPDGKDFIPYFMTNRTWFGIDRERVAKNEGGVFYLKDAAPPEAMWSYRNYYNGCYVDEHLISYFMLDESWYERDEEGNYKLTGKAPYLAKASFVDFMHPVSISF